jgi:hydroxypyruvate isomerase
MIMKRRNFIQNAATVAAMAGISNSALSNNVTGGKSSNSAKFKLKYAPEIGSFPELAGKDPVEVIKFCADQGFRAIFENGFSARPIEEQDKIVAELARHNMDMGPFTIYADFSKESMVLKDHDIQEMLIKKVNEGVELSKRTGFKHALMVPGRYNERMAWDYQTANVIDNMRELSEIAEGGGLTIVLEPLNKEDHPGLFLSGIPQAYAICRAVNSPACKIISDIYHQQITEGNIIPNIDAAWSEIAAFHLGDNPGRNEPGTGEINFQSIFKHLSEKGYNGVLCMEHGRSIKGKEGELALIQAYRKVDSF